MTPTTDDNHKTRRRARPPLIGPALFSRLTELLEIHERHLLAVSLLGHRIQPDGTLTATDVADLVTLLHGTKS